MVLVKLTTAGGRVMYLDVESYCALPLMLVLGSKVEFVRWQEAA